MPEDSGGVCYQNGDLVNVNYQMCDVTNKQIVDMLDPRNPQVTFTCDAEDATCAFQCEQKLFSEILLYANTRQSGSRRKSHSSARWTPVWPARKTPWSRTAPPTNARMLSAVVFRIECYAGKTGLWISQSF